MKKDIVILEAIKAGRITADGATGTVFSHSKNGTTLIKGALDADGYRMFCLSFKGFHKPVRMNRIVWLCCRGSIPDGLVVDHINRIRNDDRIENLRLATQKENAANSPSRGGSKNSFNKFPPSIISAIRDEFAAGVMSIAAIGRKFQVSESHTHRIVKRSTWTEEAL